MSAPERIWIDPTGLVMGWTDDRAQVAAGDVEYVRADLHAAEVADAERRTDVAYEQGRMAR
jgi:hypothetical protein